MGDWSALVAHRYQHCHAHGDPRFHLAEYEAGRGIRDIGGNLKPAVHGTGMQYAHAGAGQRQMAHGQTVAGGIIAQIRQQTGLLAFKLKPQAHDGIHTAYGFIQVGEELSGPQAASGGQQRPRRAETQPDTEPGKQVGIGTGHPAMGHITEDKQGLSRKLASPCLTQGKRIQQGLSGMGVPAIPRVDHGTAQPFGQKARRTAAGVAQNHHIGIHGLQRERGYP